MLLQSCTSVVTELYQCCYRAVPVLLQSCTSMVLQSCTSVVAELYQHGVTELYQHGVTELVQHGVMLIQWTSCLYGLP